MFEVKSLKNEEGKRTITKLTNYLERFKGEKRRIFLDSETFCSLQEGCRVILRVSKYGGVFVLEYANPAVTLIISNAEIRNKIASIEIITLTKKDQVIYSKQVMNEPKDAILFLKTANIL